MLPFTTSIELLLKDVTQDKALMLYKENCHQDAFYFTFSPIFL